MGNVVIEPPAGFRILKDRELVQPGDIFWLDGRKEWIPASSTIGQQAYDGRFARSEYKPLTNQEETW